MIIIVLVAVVAVVLAFLASSVRVLKQYERAVLFHLGKVRDGERGPRRKNDWSDSDREAHVALALPLRLAVFGYGVGGIRDSSCSSSSSCGCSKPTCTTVERGRVRPTTAELGASSTQRMPTRSLHLEYANA